MTKRVTRSSDESAKDFICLQSKKNQIVKRIPQKSSMIVSLHKYMQKDTWGENAVSGKPIRKKRIRKRKPAKASTHEDTNDDDNNDNDSVTSFHTAPSSPETEHLDQPLSTWKPKHKIKIEPEDFFETLIPQWKPKPSKKNEPTSSMMKPLANPFASNWGQNF